MYYRSTIVHKVHMIRQKKRIFYLILKKKTLTVLLSYYPPVKLDDEKKFIQIIQRFKDLFLI